MPKTGCYGEGRFLVKRLSRACMEKQTLNVEEEEEEEGLHTKRV